MNLFDLFATISLDSSGYEEGLGDAEKKTQSFGSKLSGGLQKAAKVATAAVGAVSAAGVALAGTMVKGAAETAAYVGDEREEGFAHGGAVRDVLAEGVFARDGLLAALFPVDAVV